VRLPRSRVDGVQVFILLRHSVPDMSSYQMPERLLAQARTVWLKAQQDETEQPAGQFVRDMLHVLSLLNISTVEQKVCFPWCMCTCDPSHEQLSNAERLLAHARPV
jgi:hypothetical protein